MVVAVAVAVVQTAAMHAAKQRARYALARRRTLHIGGSRFGGGCQPRLRASEDGPNLRACQPPRLPARASEADIHGHGGSGMTPPNGAYVIVQPIHHAEPQQHAARDCQNDLRSGGGIRRLRACMHACASRGALFSPCVRIYQAGARLFRQQSACKTCAAIARWSTSQREPDRTDGRRVRVGFCLL